MIYQLGYIIDVFGQNEQCTCTGRLIAIYDTSVYAVPVYTFYKVRSYTAHINLFYTLHHFPRILPSRLVSKYGIST